MSGTLGLRRIHQSRLTRRLINLYLGLILFGVGIAMMVRADLGLSPWDVFHQGVAGRTGLPLGVVVIFSSVLVLALWVPLRQRPGLGTISNVIVVGLVVDVALAITPEPSQLVPRILLLAGGTVAIAAATGLYVGAGLGPGPRDGLMTGLAARGLSVRRARTFIEVAVLATGWLLGGTVGVGTVVFAVAIGPLVQILLPKLSVRQNDLTATTGSPAKIGVPPNHRALAGVEA